MIYLPDLMDLRELTQMVDEGYVRRQNHPAYDYAILNYTDKAQYENEWNAVTRQCRGLIFDTLTREVLARPFPKFFNFGQAGAPFPSRREKVWVHDKADGSLGVMYKTPKGPAIATRGSFTSKQALHATRVLRDRYGYWIDTEYHSYLPFTYLFEIVYPENRVVLDYGDFDDLILLGGITNIDGNYTPPRDIQWHGFKAEPLLYRTLGEVLDAPDRDNAEGVVCYFPALREFVKVKQADYVALHAIVTNTSARRLWEYLAVNECWGLIETPKHWGSYLGISPDTAERCRDVHWRHRLLENVPDEFHQWATNKLVEIEQRVKDRYVESLALAESLRGAASRREQFERVKHHPDQKQILGYLRRGDTAQLLLKAWRDARPEAEDRPFAQSEDVA